MFPSRATITIFHYRGFKGGLLIAACAAFASAGAAQTTNQFLPAAQPQEIDLYDSQSPSILLNSYGTKPGTLSQSGSLPGGIGTYSDSATVTVGTDPSVSVSDNLTLTSAASGGLFVWPEAGLDYSIEISGPANVEVPVDLVGSLFESWSANADSGGDAQILIRDPNANTVLQMDLLGQPGATETESADQVLYLMSNTEYEVDLGAEAALSVDADNPVGTYTATTTVDPMFSIDPSFSLQGYSLGVSPGLVPDADSTWVLCAVAFIGLAGCRRERAA